MEEPPFFLPDGLRFHCLRCGDCCRGWTVLVDDATQDALARVDWAKHSPELSGKKLFEKKEAKKLKDVDREIRRTLKQQ